MYLCYGHVSLICEQFFPLYIVSQSMCTFSFVSGLPTIHILIIGQETLMLLLTSISLNRFPAMASHQGVLTLALTVVLLALPSLIYGVTLHVRPTSTNTPCPTHPCQTLSEYAQDPGQYFNDSNLTLHFLPGNHTLDFNLAITNINQLKIHGALLPTKVVCKPRVGFAFSNIYRMSIDGLAFYCLCCQT